MSRQGGWVCHRPWEVGGEKGPELSRVKGLGRGRGRGWGISLELGCDVGGSRRGGGRTAQG